MAIAPLAPQSPEPVVWPKFWPLFVGLTPFVVLLVLALIPASRDAINDHPLWATLAGGLVVLIWLGFFGGVLAHGLDAWLRTFDFVVNRTYGPNIAGWKGLQRIRFLLSRGGLLDGYSLPIVLWTLLAVYIMVFGPTRTPLNEIGWIDTASKLMRGPTWGEFIQGLGLGLALYAAGALGLIVAWVAAALLLSQLTGGTHRLAMVTLLVLVTTAALIGGLLLAVWLFGSQANVRPEADNLIYPHLFLPFILLAAVVAYFAQYLAERLLRGFKRDHGAAWTDPALLQRAELFVRLPSLGDAWKELSFTHNARSGVDVPLRQPHLLIYPIAVAVLLVPSAHMNFAAVAAGLFAWSVLALAGTHPRLNNVLNWLNRLFFHGVLWLVSALVMVLAACRFADISYIATITNSASSLTLVWFLVSIYITLWYYKYWIGHWLGEQLLDLLRAGPPAQGPVPYPIAAAFRDNPYVDVQERCLQTHGTRFVAVGTFRNTDQQGRPRHGQAWEFYDQVGLFESIIQQQPAVAKASTGQTIVVSEPADPEAVARRYRLNDLKQRVHVYYAILDVLLVVVVGVFFWARLKPTPKAELEALSAAEKPFVLADHLFQSKAEMEGAAPPKPVILFAASGGGTRAALYSAAVLRGLHDLGATGDVKLCSGVSGGSATIAYFAIQGEQLKKPDPAPPNKKPWDSFAEKLSAPFIDDVLCGTLELRIALGTRMGFLLDESLHRHMVGLNIPLAKGMTLQDATDKAGLGIIFNTTLTGAEKNKKAADPTQAGSRLIVTNLKIDADVFPSPKQQFAGLEQEYLHYVVVNYPAARLTTGAALSANFPPVFSNAAVDILQGDDAGRYWVTDGGAAENRGAVSLLYVLRQALRQEFDKKPDQRRKPRPIQIVIAEASAMSLDFSQDRGVSAMFGAAEKFASQLASELLIKIGGDYRDLGGKHLDVRFLPMPLVLRSRGGVGTHWKLPAYVTLANPKGEKQAKENKEDLKLILSDTQTRNLIMDLYLPPEKRSLKNATGSEKELLEKAWGWIEHQDEARRFDLHRRNWDKLKEDFKAWYGH